MNMWHTSGKTIYEGGLIVGVCLDDHQATSIVKRHNNLCAETRDKFINSVTGSNAMSPKTGV